MLRLAGDWQDTRLTLPPGGWRNELTGEEWSGGQGLGALLRRFPVALLAKVDNTVGA
jgi:(1->4)-alpha-D-glucan 1-alpha-D-glucosylmutase